MVHLRFTFKFIIYSKLNILLARQGYHPIDIRVVRRNTDSGSLRVFGFVEFSDVHTAEDWIKSNHVAFFI